MLETEAKLFIQGKIKEGLYSLVWSFILDSENDENPSDTRNGSEIYGKIGPLMRFTNLPRNARRRGRYRHGPKLNWEVLDEGCDGA
ncbi:MAG: hypothetical protein FWD61_10905 [Phycisphaerales bacterium]|nr:hypothetical protein [Phycisphaerales bacterium]